jgi:DnaJ family protein C protein 27
MWGPLISKRHCWRARNRNCAEAKLLSGVETILRSKPQKRGFFFLSFDPFALFFKVCFVFFRVLTPAVMASSCSALGVSGKRPGPGLVVHHCILCSVFFVSRFYSTTKTEKGIEMSHEDAATLFGARRLPQDAKAVVAAIAPPPQQRLKIISMGDEQSGKSCLIKRYCEERFIPKYIATIGIDYGVKSVAVDGFGSIRVNFWDLAGARDFLEIRNEFYKDSQGAILVYDVTNPASFAALDGWLAEAKQFGAKDLVGVVCANKVDLVAAGGGKKRAVSEQDGRRWATAKGFAYYETSAQSGQNVKEMLMQLFQDTMMLRRS